LPGYSQAEYGKLEYPSIAADSKRNVYLAYNFTSEAGKEAIFLSSFNDSELQFKEIPQTVPSKRRLKIAEQPGWKTPVQVSAESGVEYRPRIAVTPEDVIFRRVCHVESEELISGPV